MLASVIRSVVAPTLREAPDRCGIASITEVDVSPDTSFATVYVSSLEDNEALIAHLHDRHKEIQHQLHLSLQRRKVPQLRWRIDERIERGNRIDDILKD